MAKIYLIEGPVGAGKSTYARELSQKIKAPHINLDAWMSRLFRPDRPDTGTMEWYVERKARCAEQIWDVVCSIINASCDVILEVGLVRRQSRYAMYKRVEENNYNIHVYVLDAPRDVRRERVRNRNFEKGSTFSMEVPDEIFEMASDMWEEPDDMECNEHNIEFLLT